MAPVEEGVITWLSGCSSSLLISLVSILLIIIFVTLCSLCSSCYSESHIHFCRQEKKNILFPQKKVHGVTEQPSRNVNRLEHGQSHGQELISTQSQIPAVAIGTSSPHCVRILPLPSLPLDPMAHLEPLRHMPSFHPQECGNVTSCSDEYMPTASDVTDHKYSLLKNGLNEENPYEYISELPLLPLSDRAEGESETPTLIMTNLVELDVNHSDTALSKPVNNQEMEQLLASPPAQSDRCLISTEPTVVYAAVNWKTKSQKHTETVLETYVVEDINDIAVPPIPEKHF